LNISACSWNASDILVMAPTHVSTEFRVVEAIKGDTPLGTVLMLEGLAPPDGVTSPLAELAAQPDDIRATPFEAAPPIGETDRVIVFLRRPGAQPEYTPRPDLPADTVGWQPANWEGDLRTSTIWLQSGVAYGFWQTINPGPSHLVVLRSTEEKLREEIRAVLRLRESLDRSLANPDQEARAKELAVLVRSDDPVARLSALRHLEGGGGAGAEALQELLADPSLLRQHAAIVGALVRTGASDLHLDQILERETRYWAQACRALPLHWGDLTLLPDETPRWHQSLAYDTLAGIRQFHLKRDLAAVREFAAVWNTCPPPYENQPLSGSQVSRELDLLLGPDAH
jgi:hypothetical protein